MGPIALGFFVTVVTCTGLGVVGSIAEISGAVVAPGMVVVEDRTKRVQHQEGGIVAGIFVDNGHRVREGDVLLRLDDTQIRARLEIVRKRLAQLEARVARLAAERDNRPAPNFAAPLTPEQREIIAIERALFEARRDAMINRKTQLTQRTIEINKGIEGLSADIAAIGEQHRIAKLEHGILRQLFEKQHVPITRVLQLEREIAALTGRRGQRVAEVARAREQIIEIRLQLVNLDTEFRRDVLRELAAAEARIAELAERKTTAEDVLTRIDIRAPIAGEIHDLAVHTVGGVIRAVETLMIVVPHGSKLVVESRVAPADIDQVTVGQKALLRLVNFNRRMTPELEAYVTVVAADVTIEPASTPNGGIARAQQPYFATRLEITESELGKLDGGRLLPGMQVDAFIKTEERTVLSYLLKPFTARLAHAMREQ